MMRILSGNGWEESLGESLSTAPGPPMSLIIKEEEKTASRYSVVSLGMTMNITAR